MATTGIPRPLTLRLLDHSLNDHNPFLRLPREIRDHIYALVLDEPILWNRRHVPTCPLSTPDAPSEEPPWVTHLACSINPLRDLRVAECRSTCLTRRSMGLLRVCQQISKEATSTFFQINTICFYRSKTLVDTLYSISEATLPKIHKLSLMQMDNEVLYAPNRREVLQVLIRLPNLRELDIGPTYFASHAPKFLALPSLTTLRFSILNAAVMALPLQSAWVYICRSRAFPIPICDQPRCHPREEDDDDEQLASRARSLRKRRLKTNCPKCQSNGEEFDTLVRQWAELTHDSGETWRAVVEARLDDSLPVMPRDSTLPYGMRIPLADGKMHDVQVWGLPRYTEEERRKRVVASKRALIVKRGPVPVFAAEGDEDEEAGKAVKSQAQFRSGSRRVGPDVDEVEVGPSREEKRRMNHELDELAARKAAQKAKRNQRRSEREEAAERKAARRRV